MPERAAHVREHVHGPNHPVEAINRRGCWQ